MSIAGKDGDGTLWFLTSIESPKIDELANDARALAVMQSSNQFVVVRGLTSISRDQAKVDELWSEAQRIWFEGKNDPDIALAFHQSKQSSGTMRVRAVSVLPFER